jgi:hypothetical protein
MKKLSELLAEGKKPILTGMERHEKAIGEHVAKGIIDMHDSMWRNEKGSRAKKTAKDHGGILKGALQSATEAGDSSAHERGDPHIFHYHHFDEIKKHTIAHIARKLDAHIKQHGISGLPEEE